MQVKCQCRNVKRHTLSCYCLPSDVPSRRAVNGHACLLDDFTKEPAFDVAGVVGHGHGAWSVRMLEVVVGVVVRETGTFQGPHDFPC